MAFTGPLTQFSPTALLEMMGEKQKSGVLEIRSESGWVRFYLESGCLTSMSNSWGEVEYLLARVDVYGDAAMLRKKEQLLQTRLFDSVMDVVQWKNGTFYFNTSKVSQPPFTFAEPLPVLPVLYEGLRLADEWEAESETSVLDFAEFKAHPEKVSSSQVTRSQLRLLATIGDGKTTREVLFERQVGKLEIVRDLAVLLEQGLVEVPITKARTAEANLNSSFSDSLSSHAQQEEQAQIRVDELLESLKDHGLFLRFMQSPKVQRKLGWMVDHFIEIERDFALLQLLQTLLGKYPALEVRLRHQVVLFLPYLVNALHKNEKKIHIREMLQVLRKAMAFETHIECSVRLFLVAADLARSFEPAELEKRGVTQALQERFTALKLESNEIRLRLSKALLAVRAPQLCQSVVLGLDDPALFEAMLGELQQVGEPAVGALVELLTLSRHRKVRYMLLHLLAQMGPASQPFLLEKLRSQRWYIKRNCLLLLGKIGTAEALPVLVDELDHNHEQVRAHALHAYCALGARDAQKRVLAELSTRKWVTRKACIDLLKTFGDEEGCIAVCRLVAEWSNEDPMQYGPTVIWLTELVHQQRSRRSVPYICRLLREPCFEEHAAELAPAIVEIITCVRLFGDATYLDILRRWTDSMHFTIREAAVHAYNVLLSQAPNLSSRDKKQLGVRLPGEEFFDEVLDRYLPMDQKPFEEPVRHAPALAPSTPKLGGKPSPRHKDIPSARKSATSLHQREAQAVPTPPVVVAPGARSALRLQREAEREHRRSTRKLREGIDLRGFFASASDGFVILSDEEG